MESDSYLGEPDVRLVDDPVGFFDERLGVDGRHLELLGSGEEVGGLVLGRLGLGLDGGRLGGQVVAQSLGGGQLIPACADQSVNCRRNCSPSGQLLMMTNYEDFDRRVD